MRIETGHPVMGDVQQVDADRVRFVAEDGNAIFEVSIVDGRTIEIRGVSVYEADGVLYCEMLNVSPRASNSIHIQTRKYEDRV